MIWIHVLEALPKYGLNVLVTDGKSVGMGWLDTYTNRITGKREDFWYAPNCSVCEEDITHWLPLPDPPGK